LDKKLHGVKKGFVPWAVTERDGQKLCPLCGEVYIPKDFSKLPARLSLSEWHRNDLDPQYFQKKIADISDQELYESLDWTKISEGRKAPAKNIRTEVSRILIADKERKIENCRFYGFNQFNERAFITVDEYRSLMNGDTAKYNSLMRNAQNVLDYNIPYGVRFFKFDGAIDFDYNFGESGKYGFHYWGWGYYLTCAYMLTGDKRYVEAFDAMFNRWYEQRNSIKNTLRQYDVVWYELGIAARLPMFIDAFRLFKNLPELREVTKDRLIRTLLGSGRWLAKALEKNPYHPYNWPIHSAVSEAYLAVTFPEFRESKAWLGAAKKVMEEHMNRDVLKDGGYLERTPGYSAGVLSHFYSFLKILEHFSSDKAYFARYRDRIEKMVEFFVLTMSPVGTWCPFNDSQRKSAVELILKYGNEFKRGDFIGPVQPFISRTELGQLSVAPSFPKVTSVDLRPSCFAVMRSSWSKDAGMMVINYGPAANHNHLDVLDFEIYAHGKAIAIDAGIGPKGYDDELHMNWYRATPSHNMIMVDDSNIVRGETHVQNLVWAGQKLTDFFAAEHLGYRSTLGITDRRHVAFVKPDYWVILDKISTVEAGHRADWRLHSPLSLEEFSSGFRSKESPGFIVIPADDPFGGLRVTKGQGMASLSGLPEEKEPFRSVNYVSIQRSLSGPDDHIAVLVYPFVSGSPDLEFKLIESSAGVKGYRVKHGQFEDILFFSDGKKWRMTDRIESDALFLLVRYSSAKLSRVSVVGAMECRLGAETIVKASRRTNFERTYEE
jgi:hypothetical protein